MYKNDPKDFPEDIADVMRKVYKLYEDRENPDRSPLLAFAVDDLYYELKSLRTFQLKPDYEVVEMQNYFRSLIYD